MSSQDIGLPLGVRALAAELKALPRGIRKQEHPRPHGLVSSELRGVRRLAPPWHAIMLGSSKVIPISLSANVLPRAEA